MNWEPLLEKGEVLRWEGRPAPRCYTFRNWRHSLFGVLLVVFCLYWLGMAVQLAAVYHWPWLPLVPAPILAVGFYLALGHLLWARLEWEQVFYAVTDRRVLVRRGLRGGRLQQLPLERLVWFQLRPYGEELATLRLRGGAEGERLALCCVEYPRRVSALLETALAASAAECPLPGGE